ncbi:MBL fold metallo-hydrolase [Bordetella genomosp. 10]|nr:MBL fold metallo-hydrolase [Bordetella genomosp. 10]
MEVAARRPVVTAFFDEATCTVSYVVRDPASRHCAVIDSVMDFDPASGRASTVAADRILAFIESEGLQPQWLLETHVHADHLSAAPYLRQRAGGRLAMGREIRTVQAHFGRLFNEGSAFARDGSQFDALFQDGDRFAVGDMAAMALHVPGHTPACMAYVIGDAVFPGDTLFMPDYGTARCDFPGGDARALYRSIRRLMRLPHETRLFLCHDYKAEGRAEYAWETTVSAQRVTNVHVRDGVGEEAFVSMRNERDATLSMPRLLLPAIQVNMRAGRFPPKEDNGMSYLKLPIRMDKSGPRRRVSRPRER